MLSTIPYITRHQGGAWDSWKRLRLLLSLSEPKWCLIARLYQLCVQWVSQTENYVDTCQESNLWLVGLKTYRKHNSWHVYSKIKATVLSGTYSQVSACDCNRIWESIIFWSGDTGILLFSSAQIPWNNSCVNWVKNNGRCKEQKGTCEIECLASGGVGCALAKLPLTYCNTVGTGDIPGNVQAQYMPLNSSWCSSSPSSRPWFTFKTLTQ